MSAHALIRQAQVSGVALRLVGGKVKASGPREAIARLLVPLRTRHRVCRSAFSTADIESIK